ncbi:MAG TPA: hypothetical protein VF630_19140 [Hymenobacter sp.]
MAGGGASETAVSGKFERIRVAVEEHRFADEKECRAAAASYHRNNHAEDADGELREVTPAPLVLSWRAKNIPVEVRFVVLPAAEVSQPGEVLPYWEINRRSDNSEKDIRAAIKEFGDKRNWKLVKGPVQDAKETKGKRPWRAVMKRELPNSPSSKDSFRALRAEEFGIIINPPFP